jgi:tetratricopeptide (TPR) repeat protein
LASPELLARTALAFPQGVAAGAVNTERVGLLEDALAGLGEQDDALRARVMARLAWELFWSEESPTRCESLAGEAIALARRTSDTSTLAYTLNAKRYATWGTGSIEDRLATGTELQALARSTRDSELVMEAHHWRVIDLLELGDVDGDDREIEAHARLAAGLRQPLYLWWSAMWRATRATMSGSFAEAERHAHHAFDMGDRVQRANAGTTFQTQLMLLRRERGQLDEVAHGLLTWTTAHAHLALGASFRCGLAQVFSELGREAETRAVFEQLAAERFGGRHPTDLCSDMACLAEACAFLDDSARAPMVYERLLPYTGRNVVVGPAVGCFGPVDRFLGLLATTMRRFDEAETYYAAALDLAVKMAAPPFVARTQYDHAAMLAVRGRRMDLAKARVLLDQAVETARRLEMARVAERAEALRQTLTTGTRAVTPSTTSLRREGDYWTIVFEATTVRMRDCDGLRYLAQLLASPARSFHALELVARGNRRRGVAPPTDAFADAALAQARLRIMRLGDAGAVLDEQAMAAYQRRLGDLDVELEQARAANDVGQAERLRVELDALVGELGRAIGLHGRRRRAADVAERARVAVTKALHRVLARIKRNHERLGHHLTHTVRTGMFCVYSPDPRVQISWDVSGET